MSFAGIPLEVYRSEGQPIYCSKEDQSRLDSREDPEIFGVQGVHMKVISYSWKKNVLHLKLRLQLVSCIDEKAWYFEQPDTEDFLEAHIPTGLFTGNFITSSFYKVADNVYYTNLEIPVESLLSAKNLRKYEEGLKVTSTTNISYRYKDMHSDVRPSFKNNDGRYPVTFTIEAIIQKNKILKISSRIL